MLSSIHSTSLSRCTFSSLAYDGSLAVKSVTEEPTTDTIVMATATSTTTSPRNAAHVGTPAPANHFIQEFGQSDRETIQNAENQASVPQALTMLNGPIYNQIVNAQSVISRKVAAEEAPEAKLNQLYLSMLSREPNEREKKIILSRVEERGDELYKDVVFALLNNQEFLFIR